MIFKPFVEEAKEVKTEFIYWRELNTICYSVLETKKMYKF